MLITADFETVTNPNFLRVWGWGICEIETEKFHCGTSMDDFIRKLRELKVKKCWFHNLKFDGEFILNWLFNNGYRWRQPDRKKHETLSVKDFETLISDRGMFYSLKVRFSAKETIEFYDSLKIITMPVEKVARTFDLPIRKLHIDYDEYRAEWHKLTSMEIDYIRNDVCIMAKALKTIFGMGYTKITQGSNALQDYKDLCGNAFKTLFPIPEYDKEIRQSYRGGWTYLNPLYADKCVENGRTLDVNSLYPSRMYYEKLPFGTPIQFEGEYRKEEYPAFDVYIQKFRCEFELKEGMLPTLQLKTTAGFLPTEYVTDSKGDCIALCMCSVDMALFFEHYNVYNLEFLGGYAFRSSRRLFTEYIDKWIKVKNDAAKTGNMGMRQWAKIMLNSLYGKFATNPICGQREPYRDEEGAIHYKDLETEVRQPVYLPVGAFITAYARNFTIRAAQKIREYSKEKYGKDMFIYSDTDSIHTTLPEEDCKEILDVDDYELGAWKIENKWNRGHFIRAKTYVEETDGVLAVTCAGMPENIKKEVTWENFKIGTIFYGKLMPLHFPGGIVLMPTTFQIKP